MLASLGGLLILLAMASATAGAVCAVAAGLSRSASAWSLARGLAYAFAASMILANVVMVVALVNLDLTVPYVAQVGEKASPTYIRVVSLWSSLEGSILFWGAILGAYVAAATAQNGEKDPDVMTWATATWLVVGAFFALLLAGPAHPFLPALDPPPADGRGPNPLLQNHLLMIVHPPMLYLGYVGMTIPFGIAVGALVAGRLGAAQLAPIRTWLLVPWGFLTSGIVLGGWWAYEVLGWGGYWAWDPVENASLLPWLTGTAALHAAMLPHRREAMKGWTITLVLSTFLLTLLGTFMTRSGVFNSVHAFAQSDIGPVFLGFLAVWMLVCVVLLAVRVDHLESEGAVSQPMSRESAFLLNNLLFVVLTFTVLLGTVFPLIAEAVQGVRVSVGEPYFNKMAVPIGVAILWLMGVGPALPWGAPSSARVAAGLGPPLVAGAVAGGVAWAFGITDPKPLLTMACAGFTTWVTLDQLRIGGSVRRVGGYVVHVGIIVIIVSIALSSAYRTDAELVLSKGECARFEGHELCYVSERTDVEPHRVRRIATLRLDGDTVLEPALVTYKRMGEPIGSPDVHTLATHDLYTTLMNLDARGERAGLHVFRNPVQVWLWIGAGIAAIGTALSLVPGRAHVARRAQAAESAPDEASA